MKKVILFLPKERTNPPDPSVNIIKNYVGMADSKCLCDTVVVCFPHVMAQSAGLKTVPFLQEIPITSMDGSLVGKSIPITVYIVLLSNPKHMYPTKYKAPTDDKANKDQMMIFFPFLFFLYGRKHCWKKEILITSIFCFSHNAFETFPLLGD